jgi:hypothetical protein
MTNTFRTDVAAGLIAIARAWAKGLTGAGLAREARCGILMVVRALEKEYPEIAPPREYQFHVIDPKSMLDLYAQK